MRDIWERFIKAFDLPKLEMVGQQSKTKPFMKAIHLLLIIGVACLSHAIKVAASEAELQTYVGIIKTESVSIGGETIGIILATITNGVYELNFNKNNELKQQAIKHDGEQVVVWGEYMSQPGTEVKSHRVINVKRLLASGVYENFDKKDMLLKEMQACRESLVVAREQIAMLNYTIEKQQQELKMATEINRGLSEQLRKYLEPTNKKVPAKNTPIKPTE